MRGDNRTKSDIDFDEFEDSVREYLDEEQIPSDTQATKNGYDLGFTVIAVVSSIAQYKYKQNRKQNVKR